jgi:hypothetical protein
MLLFFLSLAPDGLQKRIRAAGLALISRSPGFEIEKNWKDLK